MAYNIDNIIVNLKKEIRENSGGGGNPITVNMLKNVLLRGQETINETFSYEVTEPGFLVYSLQAMTGADITFTYNETSLLYADGYRKVAGGFLPVTTGDEIAFSCVSEGSDENLILNIAFITGLEISEPDHN